MSRANCAGHGILTDAMGPTLRELPVKGDGQTHTEGLGRVCAETPSSQPVALHAGGQYQGMLLGGEVG